MAKLTLWYDDDGNELMPGDWVTVNGDIRTSVEENADRDRYLKGVSSDLIIDSLERVSEGPDSPDE